MEDTDRDRRKISNIVVDWKAQLRLFIPFGLLFLTGVIIVVLMYMQVSELLAELSAGNDFSTIARVTEMSGHMLLIASVGIVLMAGISLITWLMYSHRIFGPVVPIRRQLANLREGKYDSKKIILRRYDEFKDVVDDLNQLTEKLAKR